MCVGQLFGGGGSSKATNVLLAQTLAAQQAATAAAAQAAVSPADNGQAASDNDTRIRRLMAARGQAGTLQGGDLAPATVASKQLLGA